MNIWNRIRLGAAQYMPAPVDTDDDSEELASKLDPKERSELEHAASTMSFGELRSYVTKLAGRTRSNRPTLDPMDAPSSVPLDRVDEITEKRMRDLLASVPKPAIRADY